MNKEFHHNIIISKELPDVGIIVESRRHRPDFADKPHTHNYLSILYVVSGEGFLEYDHSRYVLTSNSVVALNRDLSHKFLDKPKNPMTAFSIYFDMAKIGFNQHIIDYLFDSDRPFIIPIYYAEQIKKSLRQILHEQSYRPPGYKLAIKEISSLVMLNIYRAKLDLSKLKKQDNPSESISRVKAVLDYIALNYHQQHNLNETARMAKVSQRQFTNLCRKITGTSFIKFLNKHRCQKAKNLIEATDMSIASIAFEMGYEDLSTFYRAFNYIYKNSPMSYRSHLK